MSYPERAHSDSAFPKGVAPSNLSEVDPAYFYLIDASQRTVEAWLRRGSQSRPRARSVRATADGYEIGLGQKNDSSIPVVRTRMSPTPFDDLDKIVKEQLDDGFIEAGSAWTL